jgi:hypothetical protein
MAPATKGLSLFNLSSKKDKASKSSSELPQHPRSTSCMSSAPQRRDHSLNAVLKRSIRGISTLKLYTGINPLAACIPALTHPHLFRCTLRFAAFLQRKARSRVAWS